MYSSARMTMSNCVERLQAGYRNTYGSLKPEYADLIGWVATMALETIANTDALYHDTEHTVLVTLVGQQILHGKQICEGNVTPEDWVHCIISWLCHDIGYIKGICGQDQAYIRSYVTGIDQQRVSLPLGATDASLTPYHVDRGKQFVAEYFRGNPLVNISKIQANIELTRFPVPATELYQEVTSYPGLVRAADLIGQLSDPHYLNKLPALFGEFEETGANQCLGYRHPGDLRAGYPKFFWNVVFNYIKGALAYLERTQDGQQIIANLYKNVLVVERELLELAKPEEICDRLSVAC